MKILVYGINYAPELSGIGQYTAGMANFLLDAGHDVRVVAAPPYYPEWKIKSGFSSARYTRETMTGVRVWRAPLWVPAQPKGMRRIVHLASFALTSLPLMVRHLFWRPDAVFSVAPSLLNAPAAWLVARLCGAHAWLHVQDYEVDAAFRLGMLKGSWRKRLALSFERTLLRRFDTVSTISRRMVERALSKGIPSTRIVHFANWVDTSTIRPLGRVSAMRAELNIDPAATVVLYSGNMGMKQGLPVVADAAVALRSRADIVFVFCGDGPAKEQLMAQCVDLPTCRFLSLQPFERLNELLNLADIHVLPQRAEAADLVMPSKLGGMFASGRPVVAMAHPGTELHDTVASRGVVIEPESLAPLVTAIEELASDPARRERLGRAGRAYGLSAMSRDAVLAAFESTLAARCSNQDTATLEIAELDLPGRDV